MDNKILHDSIDEALYVLVHKLNLTNEQQSFAKETMVVLKDEIDRKSSWLYKEAYDSGYKTGLECSE